MCIGFLFEALSVFSFICWAAPTNVPINQIFGVRTGLGFSVITFDWSQITWIGSPLMGIFIPLDGFQKLIPLQFHGGQNSTSSLVLFYSSGY